MKNLSKVLVLVLSAIMVLAMSASVFAGTITVENATNGQTYTAYKIFNAVYSEDGSKVTYTVPSDKEQYVTSPFSVSTAKASNNEKIVTLANGTEDEAVIAWAKANYQNFDATGTPLTYGADGTATATVGSGYYFVTSTLGSMVTIKSVNDTATIVDKNESAPGTPAKVITAEDSSVNEALDQTNQTLETNDAAVGSVEDFKVEFNAVNWVQDEVSDETATEDPRKGTKVTEWNITDTPVGLDIDDSTVAITVNGSAPVEDATVTKDGDTLKIRIPWVDANGKSLYATTEAGKERIPVVITYKATVTDAAATAVATNTVDVKYNNTTSVGTDTTSTYTYKFDLAKTDGENPLDGAEFELYYANESGASVGNALKFTVVNGVYHYDPAGSVTHIAPTGTTAKASIVGLDNTKYVLKEVVVPDGYTQAEDKVVDGLSRVDVAAASVTTATVVNEQGTVLPSTGGIGTTIFYILGSLLVVGCGIVLISRKRTESRK